MAKQLTLPTIQEPDIKIKKIPREGSIPWELLNLMLQGERVTHPFLQKKRGTWRAAAAVHLMRSWGYPVQTQEVRFRNNTTSKNQVIAAYYLEREFIQKYKEISQGDVSNAAKK